MSEVILSPVIVQATKNATNEGIVIMTAIIEPFKKMPDIGPALFLSTDGIFCAIIKIKIRMNFVRIEQVLP